MKRLGSPIRFVAVNWLLFIIWFWHLKSKARKIFTQKTISLANRGIYVVKRINRVCEALGFAQRVSSTVVFVVLGCYFTLESHKLWTSLHNKQYHWKVEFEALGFAQRVCSSGLITILGCYFTLESQKLWKSLHNQQSHWI